MFKKDEDEVKISLSWSDDERYPSLPLSLLILPSESSESSDYEYGDDGTVTKKSKEKKSKEATEEPTPKIISSSKPKSTDAFTDSESLFGGSSPDALITPEQSKELVDFLTRGGKLWQC